MNKTTHILGGVTLALGTAIKIELPEYSVVSLGCLAAAASFGALIPDIDKRKTTISSKHPFVSFFIRLFTTHRGFTHSLLALVLIAGTLYFINPHITLIMLSVAHYAPFTRVFIRDNIHLLTWINYGIMNGYFSHIVLDMLNPDGVPLFFPLSNHFSICKIKTGGAGEKCIRTFLFLLSIYLVWISIKNLI